MTISWKKFGIFLFEFLVGKRLLIILGFYFSSVTKKLEALYGIRYFEVLLYYYCTPPQYLQLTLS